MKRTLITFVAAMFVAAGASAGTMTVNADKASYLVGEDITITATLNVAANETLGVFGTVFYEVQWNSDVASVKNAGVTLVQGNGNQLITSGPGTGGSALTGAGGSISGPTNSACNLNGISCQFLTQTNANFVTVTLDAQTLVATLVLTADAAGSLDLAQFAAGNGTGGAITTGANFAGVTVVVPEPTTAALLGLGLLGLGIAGRRR